MATFKNINGMEVYFHAPEEVNIPKGVRYIDQWRYILDIKANEMIFPDWTKIPVIRITDDTPEWKAILEWAEEYIKVLEWKDTK